MAINNQKDFIFLNKKTFYFLNNRKIFLFDFKDFLKYKKMFFL